MFWKKSKNEDRTLVASGADTWEFLPQWARAALLRSNDEGQLGVTTPLRNAVYNLERVVGKNVYFVSFNRDNGETSCVRIRHTAV